MSAMAHVQAAVVSTIILALAAVNVSAATDLYAFEQPIYRFVEGTNIVTVYIVRTGLHNSPSSSINVVSSDGTIPGRSAVVGMDYIFQSTTVTFQSATDNQRAVNVQIIDNNVDNTDEDVHCFTLSLTNPNPSDGLLGPSALVCIIDNDNFFVGTCPPPEAMIENNGEPVIEVIVPTGSTTAPVSWTNPTPGVNVGTSYQCFTAAATLTTPSTFHTPCTNGANFPITHGYTSYNGRILVRYTVYVTTDPVVSHECEFYIRVLDNPAVHLTMVTPTPYRAGSSSGASISCFRSPPDAGISLSFGRPFQLGIPGSTILTSTSLPGGSSQSETGAAITQDLTTSIDAVGLYYCQGVNRGLTTRVYSIIHSINRYFEPAGGLVTKTANIGESVTLSVTGVGSLGTAPLWRQISNGVIVREGSGFDFTLTASAANDGDLFVVLQSASIVADNHFSMIRLIVRGCAASKWGPPGCNGVCDQCSNGGVCDDETGKCICPPGFMGTNCLTACGMHRFGWNCELQCGPGNVISSCTGNQFGLPDPYGNSCISGYTGRDCDQACESGKFGAGCTQMCSCQGGAPCDRFTGECPNPCALSPCLGGGACQSQGSAFSCQCRPGYSGDTCEIDDPCVPSPCMNGGTCQPQGSTFSCICPPEYTGGLCGFIVFQIICDEVARYGDPGTSITVTVPQPTATGGVTVQQFSYSSAQGAVTNDAIDIAIPPMGSSTIMVTATALITVSSGVQPTCTVSITVTGYPTLRQAPNVTGTSSSATVSWQAWSLNPMDTGGGLITAYTVYYSLMTSSTPSPPSWIEAGNITVTDTAQSMYMMTVGQLQPDTEYLFSVSAVGTGGAEGPRSPSASYVTASLPPSTSPFPEGSTNLVDSSTQTQGTSTGSSTSPEGTSPVVIAVVCVVAVVVIAAILLLLIYCLRRRRRQTDMASPKPQASAKPKCSAKPKSSAKDQHEMISYENDVVDETLSTDYERVGGHPTVSHPNNAAEVMPTYEDIGLPSWAQAWSITWDKMIIGERVLGKGNFGEVVNGGVMVKDELTKAAIKKLKADASPTDRQDFIEEFQTLTQIGRHPNIVGLLGACQHQETLYVALEYLPNGDLRSYLRKARCAEDDSKSDPCSSKLIQFALDVAKGMQHLAALGTIHRDLAARNILLDNNLVAKVSDFGLSRGEDIYVQTSKTRVPTRWLSIESMTRQVYTSKSDVWSFGVLLWEIASLGATPYEGIKTRNLLSRLENGYRMPKPSNCDQEIYDLMLECWQEESKDRPSFKKLATTLQALANNQKESPYMWLLPTSENYKYMNVRPELDDN